jgi:hypothetical protein
MSKATFAFGRFNPPTESGHGKLVSAVQSHAESEGGKHYVFASHSQDKKKNPLSHSDKTGAMRKMFKGANVVGGEHKTVIDAMKHLEKQGHTHVTMIAGSDRVEGFKKLLNDYNGKEYKFKKIHVKSAGHRDPDAEGAEGMSASKMRGLVSSGKRDEFISHYSDKKLGAELHDKVKKAMSEEIEAKRATFIVGGPGSGKDYVINNILSKFDLNEIQIDQLLKYPTEISEDNILINCGAELDKIETAKAILEGYDFSHIVVTVTNKVSRERNAQRERPLEESVRIRKWLDSEKIVGVLENSFNFKNTMNLNEASQFELLMFQEQIKNTLEFMIDNGYVMGEAKNPVAKNLYKFNKPKIEKDKMKYRRNPKHKQKMQEVKEPTGDLKKACWKGYTAVGLKKKNGRTVPNCVPVKEAYEEGTDEARIAYANATPGQTVDTTPTLKTKKDKTKLNKPKTDLNAQITGQEFMAPGNPMVQERLSFGKYVQLKEATISEAMEYHLNTKTPITENVFRPGSDKFFELIREAKALYAEQKYKPADEWEEDMLKSDVGEFAEYEGKQVPLDYPLNEEDSDPTKGKGIGKPWRDGEGGAVYVRDGGKIRKISFSKSGMQKKYNNPEAVKSFIARHGCLSNNDKTTAGYWACRWPRFFSKSGQLWW